MTQLNQAARKDLATRSLISDTVLRLIARSGVDLMHFKEGLDVSEKFLGEGDDAGPVVEAGYEFAGFDMHGKGGTIRMRMERLDGLFYPLPSRNGSYQHAGFGG